MNGGGSLVTFLNTIANLMTGTIGQAVAILAVTWYGYKLLFGQHDRQHAFNVVLGICLVFSGAWVVSQITGGSGSFGP